MKQRTHAVFGLWCGFSAGAAMHAEPLGRVAFCVSGVVGAVAPDIDSPASVIRHSSRFISALFHVVPVKHRGWTHTALACLLVFLLAASLHSLYGVVFAMSYWSHIVLDMMTFSGVALLRPLVKRPLYLVPKKMRVASTGRLQDGLFWLVLIALMGWAWFVSSQRSVT